MRICYVQEENSLWGGVKIVFEQAEALQARGHDVVIVAKDRPPDWYDVQVPLRQVEAFTSSTIPECDFVIGTFWTTVKAVLQIEKGCPVHLCQGYEGDISYYAQLRPEIEALYRTPMLTLSIHEPLTQLLWERFKKKACTIGQGVNHRMFHPAMTPRETSPWRVLIVGPYEVDLKGIREGLGALKTLKQEFPLQVIRVSQFPQSREEQELGVTDEYHHHLRAEAMPDVYRSCDAVLVPSWANEGFGLPAIEAMACGVPTVLSAIPSFQALAAGSEWTMFFPERDRQGMQNALRKLLSDARLRAILRARGIEVAREFSFARVAERIEQALTTGGAI
jgi:glycosyltransferase involved in cell wall biosynthesis